VPHHRVFLTLLVPFGLGPASLFFPPPLVKSSLAVIFVCEERAPPLQPIALPFSPWTPFPDSARSILGLIAFFRFPLPALQGVRAKKFSSASAFRSPSMPETEGSLSTVLEFIRQSPKSLSPSVLFPSFPQIAADSKSLSPSLPFVGTRFSFGEVFVFLCWSVFLGGGRWLKRFGGCG